MPGVLRPPPGQPTPSTSECLPCRTHISLPVFCAFPHCPHTLPHAHSLATLALLRHSPLYPAAPHSTCTMQPTCCSEPPTLITNAIPSVFRYLCMPLPSPHCITAHPACPDHPYPHQNIAINLCCKAGGYVVEASEGLCLAAFRHPAAALVWALASNSALAAHTWGHEVRRWYRFATASQTQHGQAAGSSRAAGRGPRPRTGVHVGVVHAEVNAVTGRMSYRGKVMNRTSRIAHKASSGQVRVRYGQPGRGGAGRGGAGRCRAGGLVGCRHAGRLVHLAQEQGKVAALVLHPLSLEHRRPDGRCR